MGNEDGLISLYLFSLPVTCWALRKRGISRGIETHYFSFARGYFIISYREVGAALVVHSSYTRARKEPSIVNVIIFGNYGLKTLKYVVQHITWPSVYNSICLLYLSTAFLEASIPNMKSAQHQRRTQEGADAIRKQARKTLRLHPSGFSPLL